MCKTEVITTVETQFPTKSELRKAIPQGCFQHSVVTALGLLARDTAVVLAFGALAWTCIPLSGPLAWIGWATYGFWQGAAFTGWWVLAHECGHGGFSQYKTLNDFVGWVLHSFLLVPYFSWQYSHARHHAKTNHLLDGETHIPGTMKGVVKSDRHAHDLLGDDAFAIVKLFFQLLLGWPMYLLFNSTGARRTYDKQPVKGYNLDHFRPTSRLFPPAWRNRIAMSSLGVVLTFIGLFVAGQHFGHARIALMYWPAYVWTNFWLVNYTWLQHTSPKVPHYGEDEWTWMKGALCTIDRPYSECFGFFDWMHHHIGSTHVFHHLFSDAPCYKAVEATKHLKAYLEPRGLYNYDGTPLLKAMFETAKTCHFVDSVTGTQYYRSLSDLKKNKEQ